MVQMSNVGEEVKKHCRICSGTDLRVVSGPWGRHLVCRQCGSVTKDLSFDEYQAMNPSYDPGPNIELESKEAVLEYLGVKDKEAFLLPFLKRVHGPKRMLDIGCGAGGYLVAGQNLGLEVEGVEPSDSHSTIARSLGLNVKQGYFVADEFPSDTYDLVVLSHVIEHIYEPFGFLRGIMKVLKPGGILVVSTPNAGSTVARLSSSYWVMLKTIDHVNMFSLKSLKHSPIKDLGKVESFTSEYSWESVASLLAAGKDFLRQPRTPTPNISDNKSQDHPPLEDEKPSKSNFRWRGTKVIKNGLRFASFPLHVFNQMTDRQHCLVFSIQKPQ